MLRRVCRLAGLHPGRHIGNAPQKLFVFNRLGLAQGDDLVQQRRHLFKIGRVRQALFDDLAAHIVFNHLGNRALVAFEAAQLPSNGVCNAGFHNQVEQADVAKR